VRLEPADAYAAIQRGAFLVDIRPEFQRRRDGEAPGAIVVEPNDVAAFLITGPEGHVVLMPRSFLEPGAIHGRRDELLLEEVTNSFGGCGDTAATDDQF